jgi:hypothetical protein
MCKHILTYFIIALCILGMIILPLDIAAIGNVQSQDQYDWPKIIQQLEESQYKYPNDPKIKDSLANAYNNQGVTFAKQKQWTQAEESIQKALAVKPESESIKINLSNIYFEHGYDLFQNLKDQPYDSYTHSASKQLAIQAIALNARNVNAYLLLGDVEYFNQNMNEAQQAWQQAANLAPSNQQIQQRLAKITREAQTENKMENRYNSFFIIKIDPDLDQIPGFDVNQALDTARLAVSADFNFKLTHKIPVIVYNREQYADTLVGAPEWSDGAFDGKIRVILSKNLRSFNQVNSTIVHEYTHAVIAELTNNRCPRWLNEGTAKYEEYKHGMPPSISVLALAFNTNNIIAWNKIDDSFLSKNKNEALLAYQQAFSFVYYMVQKYGMPKLVELFTKLASDPDFNKAVQQVYNTSLETIQQEWRGWLSVYLPNWAEQPVTLVD